MIDWSESQIIIAVIGIVGLLSTLAVVSRSMAANRKYELRVKPNHVVQPTDGDSALPGS